MSDVALLIKTFLRNDLLFEVIDSIEAHAGNIRHRIYIADDGEIDERKADLYSDMERDGHCIVRLPFDVGASAGRNMALRHIEEPYVLRMDDDFVFTERTRVDRMIRILEDHPSIGAVSDLEIQRHAGKGVEAGEVSQGQGFIQQHGATLWKVPVHLEDIEWESVGDVRFSRCEFGRNFLLIRRPLLDHLRWDHRLKIRGEHIDFMLQIVRRSEWDLAFTPDSEHIHAGPPPSRQPTRYRQFRYREAGYHKILYEKWGFKRILLDKPGGSSFLGRTVQLIGTHRQ